ncbi:MAG: Ala-tRNA(Pro) deacylase [Chlamydiales bacterium]|jgi:Ala-tRNA(Pro) deacylase
MTIAKKLKEYLDNEGVSYELHQHPTAYTAAEIAGSQHIPGKEFVKAVIIKADNSFQMCVLSAIHVLDFDKMKNAIGAQEVSLASESEIGKLFPTMSWELNLPSENSKA